MNKIIILGLAVATFSVATAIENNYTRKDCKVVRIENNICTFEDKTGQRWNWDIEQNENFFIGEKVNLKMHANNTSNYMYDDKIIKIIKK